MKRTLVLLTLSALALPGCTKFLPSAMHHRTKTANPAAATSSAKKPAAEHVVHKTNKPAAASPTKPAAAPTSGAHATSSAEHKS